jgi:hypothetical protein
VRAWNPASASRLRLRSFSCWTCGPLTFPRLEIEYRDELGCLIGRKIQWRLKQVRILGRLRGSIIGSRKTKISPICDDTEISNDEHRSSKRRLLVVHGVGDFNEANVKGDVEAIAALYGISTNRVETFNWDVEVGAPFLGMNLDVGVLSELGEGLLNSANLGFLHARSEYCGVPRWLLVIQNWVFAINQIFLSFVIPLIFFSFFSAYARRTLALLGIVSIFGLMTSAASTVASASVDGLMVSSRRFLLSILWPFLHFLAIPAGFGLIALTFGLLQFSLQEKFLPELTDPLDPHLLSPVFQIAINLLLKIALVGSSLILTRIALLFIAPPLKYLSDTFRYIGSETHRSRVQNLLTSKLEESTDDCDHLIVLAHSLGSVIAVDTLLNSTSKLTSVSRVSLVTMGSPIRRLFSRFFPTMYLPISVIAPVLRTHLNQFTWINVYRTFDFVGTRLSDNESDVVEYDTGQRLRNHLDYWSDVEVAKFIFKGLSKPLSAAPQERLPLVSNWQNEICGTSYENKIAGLWSNRLNIFTRLFLVLFCCGLSVFIWKLVQQLVGPLTFAEWRFFAEEDGWAKTIATEMPVWVLGLAGAAILVRFTLKKLWAEWITVYGASLLGEVEITRRSPLMRFAPPKRDPKAPPPMEEFKWIRVAGTVLVIYAPLVIYVIWRRGK